MGVPPGSLAGGDSPDLNPSTEAVLTDTGAGDAAGLAVLCLLTHLGVAV